MSLDDMELRALEEDAAAVRGVSDARLAEMERQERISSLLLTIHMGGLKPRQTAALSYLLEYILGGKN